MGKGIGNESLRSAVRGLLPLAFGPRSRGTAPCRFFRMTNDQAANASTSLDMHLPCPMETLSNGNIEYHSLNRS